MSTRPVAPQVLAKTAHSRALLFKYQSGEGLPPHRHTEIVVVAVLRGHLRLEVDGQTQELRAAEVITVQSNGFFSSEALEDHTEVLVTLLG